MSQPLYKTNKKDVGIYKELELLAVGADAHALRAGACSADDTADDTAVQPYRCNRALVRLLLTRTMKRMPLRMTITRRRRARANRVTRVRASAHACTP